MFFCKGAGMGMSRGEVGRSLAAFGFSSVGRRLRLRVRFVSSSCILFFMFCFQVCFGWLHNEMATTMYGRGEGFDGLGVKHREHGICLGEAHRCLGVDCYTKQINRFQDRPRHEKKRFVCILLYSDILSVESVHREVAAF